MDSSNLAAKSKLTRASLRISYMGKFQCPILIKYLSNIEQAKNKVSFL